MAVLLTAAAAAVVVVVVVAKGSVVRNSERKRGNRRPLTVESSRIDPSPCGRGGLSKGAQRNV